MRPSSNRRRLVTSFSETPVAAGIVRDNRESAPRGLTLSSPRLLIIGACICLGACGGPDSAIRGAPLTGSTALTETALPAGPGVVTTPRTRGGLSQSASPPRVQHVLTVVLENTDYEQALAQPFLAQLARNGGLLTNYSAV